MCLFWRRLVLLSCQPEACAEYRRNDTGKERVLLWTAYELSALYVCFKP
jgi:hypothetical protein